jgi:hypothetical protein
MKYLKLINAFVLCYGLFLLAAISGLFGFEITFGLGLGDLLYLTLVCMVTVMHIIWTIAIRKRAGASFLVPVVIFSLTSILFSLKATVWRGVEYPWSNGKLFYHYEESISLRTTGGTHCYDRT